MASTVLTTIHGQAIGGWTISPTSGCTARIARLAPAAAGTVTLSSRPSGSDSTNAAMTTVAATAASDGDPKNIAVAAAAIPATITKASDPPQLLLRFHGRGAMGVTRPTSVAIPSPKARITHATAASEMCQLKMRMSALTASGYSTMPASYPRAWRETRFPTTRWRTSQFVTEASAAMAAAIRHGSHLRVIARKPMAM